MKVQDYFLSLCVLEKQMVIPESIISNTWGLASWETEQVVRIIADLDLIIRTKLKKPSDLVHEETVEDYAVCLHDLILVLG